MSEPKLPPPLPSGPPPAALADKPVQRQAVRDGQPRHWGGVLLLVGVVWLVFELTRGSLFGFGSGFSEQRIALPPQTFAANKLRIDVDRDDVELIGWDGPGIKVEGTRHGFGWTRQAAEDELAQHDMQITLNDGVVQITSQNTSKWVLLGRSPYTDLRVMLPNDADFQVTTVSGDLKIERVAGHGSAATMSGNLTAMANRGDFTLSTTSGDLVVEEHEGKLMTSSTSSDLVVRTARGDVQAHTISGDVEVYDASGALDLKTISGDIALASDQEVVLRAETTSGDIEVHDIKLVRGASRVESISGSIELHVNPDSPLRLTMHSLSGELNSELDLHEAVNEVRSLYGLRGDGSAELELSTTSGDIFIGAR